jgi:hypothetical protein
MRLLPLYAYMAWAEKTFIIIIIIITDLITLLRIYVLGNLHLSQIVSGISFSQGKEINPIIIIIFSLVTGLFFLSLLLLNQSRSPPLRLHVSNCSTFRIMCDVPSIAVCCSE